ncbi:insertion element protein [uncultured Metabacillus sp.]|uniref:insertion element protein n=1 Tax=uncultured Metabacillus sp. TaxID=2860135 RepID=UPI0026042082|nr:insertion element protein [uncultured Metabacillus sp.]
MAKLKRLVTKEDNIVVVYSPLSNKETTNRAKDYNVLNPKQFATKYKDLLFAPVTFTWSGHTHQIQYNHCANPFCKWCGLPQKKFDVKGKPSRYKLSGYGMDKSLVCNPDPIGTTRGVSLNCNTTTVSNWSVAIEIDRLTTINKVKDIEPDYQFHKDECSAEDLTPFDSPEGFYKQGKSKVGAQVWQCKVCKKKTNILPNKVQTTTYKQKRSEILPRFAEKLLNRTPITRTCEMLKIGRGTYYDKLELLYHKCLEFLERNETRKFEALEFKEIWLNTDKMTYHLNNVRQKGQGNSSFLDTEEPQFPTNVVVTADVLSRYVFRSDVAYDWDITMGDIALDTVLLKEDHLNDFAKKNARFGQYSHYPQPPSKNDTQTISEYENDLAKFNRRAKYVDGLHVHQTYTTIAHLWLIKQLVKASEWRFITDDDKSLMTAIYRVFSDEFQRYDAHHFLCQTDKTKTRKQAQREFKQAKFDLIEWGSLRDIGTKSLRKLAYYYLSDLFETHSFHKEISTGTSRFNVYADNPIQHPLASPDRGFRSVDCKTDLSSYEPSDIANLILNVNDNATNVFIQNIRRRLSILERPLTTARGDGKSYIYSNFNPKYAQMALTILRTYYNFCLTYETTEGKDKVVATPAQRLGLTNKQFLLNDIIYLR